MRTKPKNKILFFRQKRAHSRLSLYASRDLTKYNLTNLSANIAMLPLNEIYCSDCVKFMQDELDEESIDLTITSPPYDNLRDYKGYKFNYKQVIDGLWRVTKKGGIVVWVVADQLKDNNLTYSTFRHGLAFQKRGFNAYDTIIYQKSGCALPTPRHYYNSFEYMLILSKGRPNTVNLIKDRQNVSFKGDGIATRRNKDGTMKVTTRKATQPYGIRFNIWRYAVGYNNTTRDKEAYAHPAMFPEKLAQDHIISWSNEGDLVFDPFSGSGTTAKMAYLNKRKYIACDVSQEYVDLARARLAKYKAQPCTRTDDTSQSALLDTSQDAR